MAGPPLNLHRKEFRPGSAQSGIDLSTIAFGSHTTLGYSSNNNITVVHHPSQTARGAPVSRFWGVIWRQAL
jgi:hypothetical protein